MELYRLNLGWPSFFISGFNIFDVSGIRGAGPLEASRPRSDARAENSRRPIRRELTAE